MIHRYKETLLAAGLFLLVLLIIAGLFVWIGAGMNHDFLPEDGIYYCEALNTTIELSQQGSTISFGEDTFQLQISYSGVIDYLTADDCEVKYGSVEKHLIPSRDRLYVHVEEQGRRFTFARIES